MPLQPPPKAEDDRLLKSQASELKIQRRELVEGWLENDREALQDATRRVESSAKLFGLQRASQAAQTLCSIIEEDFRPEPVQRQLAVLLALVDPLIDARRSVRT